MLKWLGHGQTAATVGMVIASLGLAITATGWLRWGYATWTVLSILSDRLRAKAERIRDDRIDLWRDSARAMGTAKAATEADLEALATWAGPIAAHPDRDVPDDIRAIIAREGLT